MNTAPSPEESTLATPLRLRTLKSTAHRLATIVPDRRRFRRVAVTLFGRFMRENRGAPLPSDPDVRRKVWPYSLL